jgi:phenolic acid decarboxylase
MRFQRMAKRQWVVQDPAKIICYQNEHLDLMRRNRDAGPAHPTAVIDQHHVPGELPP